MPLIVWVTPVSKQSAIAQFSQMIVDELVRRNQNVVVVSSDMGAIGESLFDDCVHYGDSETLRALSDSGATFVYNVGNNYGYHGGVIEICEKFPGVGVFHDVYYYDLFYGWIRSLSLDAHDEFLADIYGASVPLDLRLVEDVLAHRAEHFPMLEWVAPKFSSIITHSRFAAHRMKRLVLGPVSFVPLAYKAPIQTAASDVDEKSCVSDKMIVSTFGDANSNKRIESVIRAIASSDILKRRVQYNLVGSISDAYKSKLIDFANDLGVDLIVMGRVSPDDYARHMNATAVVCCLRYPPTESASATLVESLLSEKLTLVTDIGCYSDVPDDLVVKVSWDDEVEGLAHGMRLALENPEFADLTGRNARKWAEQTYSVDTYVDGVEVHLGARSARREDLVIWQRTRDLLKVICVGDRDEDTFSLLVENIRTFEILGASSSVGVA